MDEGPEFLPGLFLARRANYRFVFFAFLFAKIAFPLVYAAVTGSRSYHRARGAHIGCFLLRCMSLLLMLWTARPPPKMWALLRLPTNRRSNLCRRWCRRSLCWNSMWRNLQPHDVRFGRRGQLSTVIAVSVCQP